MFRTETLAFFVNKKKIGVTKIKGSISVQYSVHREK